MRITLFLALVSVLVSCTKKRDEVFVQGQGRDLLTISDYNGKEFPVETLNPIVDQKSLPTRSKSEKYKNSLDNSFSMKIVEFRSKADLLPKSTPFIALPDTKDVYKVRYHITREYLIVLKAADKQHIHSSELTAAIDSKEVNGESKTIYVPLIAYPIRGLFNTENVDQNGKASNKLIEVPARSVEEAKYFKIDLKGRTLYSSALKFDLFTRQYFTGEDKTKENEWFYSTTVVSANFLEQERNGYVLSQSSKVKFLFTQNDLTAVNVNFDPSIDITRDVNHDIVSKFSISWKDFARTENIANKFSTTEAENSQIDWAQRSHFSLDLNTAQGKVVDLEIDKDYFSYTVFNDYNKVRIKYSFLRDLNRLPYTPKKLFESDFEKFGFFSTERHEIDNYLKFKKSDYGNNIFLNRYNVNSGTIEFYFTEGSKEQYIEFAAKACDEWSQAFRDAGVALKIVCVTDKDKRKSLGDIRYNQINLIDSEIESGLYGYGPSITDPRTGEIVSATTNMHLTSIRASLVDYIREYILYKANITKQFSMLSNSGLYFEDIVASADQVTMEKNSQVPLLLKEFPVVAPNGQLKKLKIGKIESSEKRKRLLSNNFGREFDLSVTGKNINKDIENECGADLVKIVEYVKDVKELKNENEFVKSCAEKMLPKKMFGTLLHEMGHNFGLRHNFYGSVDHVNFRPNSETETEEQVRSSSVMEYTSLNEDRLNKVGYYDIAALRYGYGDSVEIFDAATKKYVAEKLDINLSIEDQLKAKGLQRRSYKFCTDEDVEIGQDPMCARHDAGTNADQIVENIINEYNNSIILYNQRLNRQRTVSPELLTSYRVRRFWIPLKNFYDQWRYKLNDHLGIGHEYLEEMDADEFERKITDKISEDPEFEGYKKAADRIFKFAMQIATLPPVYCHGTRNNQVAAVEFAGIRKLLMNIHKEVPKSCFDEKVVKHIEKEYQFTVDDQSGYELEDVRLDSKPKVIGYSWWGEPIMAGPDIIGLKPEKDIAMTVLTVRAPLTLSGTEKAFLPNFMDEPKNRNILLGYFADRISKGINGRRLVSQKHKNGLNGYLEKFSYEKPMIENMTRSIFYDGLTIPGKENATKERKRQFSVQYTSQANIIDRARYKVSTDSVNYYVIVNDDAIEAKKIMQMLETVPKRLEAAAPVSEKTFVQLNKIIDEILPLEGKPDVRTFIRFIKFLLDEESVGAKTAETKDLEMHKIHWRKVFPVEAAALKEALAPVTDAENPGAYDALNLGSVITLLENLYDPKYGTEKEGLKKSAGSPALQRLADMIYSPDYQLNRKIIKAKIKDYREQTEKQQKEAPSEDFFNYSELKVQLDLIENVLRTMRNER
jgi:hypothetical protein